MSDSFLLKQRKALAVCVYLLSAAWGFYSAVNHTTKSPGRVEMLFSVFIAIVVTLFCLTEARVQRKPIPGFAGWLILVSWPISVPLCLLWLRGKKKILHTLLVMLSVVAVCYVGEIVGALIVTPR